MKPQKIEILFPTGNVEEIRIVHKSSSSIYAYTIPRTMIDEAKKMGKLKNPALYYLIYEEENSLTQIYIGQTRGGLDRLTEHNRSKDFWNKAILFLSDDDHFNPTIILGLEKIAIEKAIDSKRVIVLNKQEQKVVINEWAACDIDHYYEEIEFLLSTMGYNFTTEIEEVKNIVTLDKRNITARGIYWGEKFEVLEGSEIRMDKASNLASYNVLRNSLMAESDIKIIDGKYILQKTITFKTPSGASDFLLGGSNNGWTQWKNKDGKSLDEIYRKVD